MLLFGQLVLLGLLGEIYLICAGTISPMVAGAAAIGVAAIGIEFVHENWNGVAAVRTDRTGTLLRVVQVGLVVPLLVIFTSQLFPAEEVQDGSFVNVFAHASGVVFGTLIAGLLPCSLSRNAVENA